MHIWPFANDWRMLRKYSTKYTGLFRIEILASYSCRITLASLITSLWVNSSHELIIGHFNRIRGWSTFLSNSNGAYELLSHKDFKRLRKRSTNNSWAQCTNRHRRRPRSLQLHWFRDSIAVNFIENFDKVWV